MQLKVEGLGAFRRSGVGSRVRGLRSSRVVYLGFGRLGGVQG